MALTGRIRKLKDNTFKSGPVIYWMQRDQRVNDNWALIYAYSKALENDVPLIVTFNLVSSFLGATIRQYSFMIEGLKKVKKYCDELNINFQLLVGNPEETIPEFIKESDASLLIADFNPLKIVRRWKKHVAEKINIPFHEVDAHNIVPCLIVSNKQEFSAYTIRPKIHKLLPEFLDEFPTIKKMKTNYFDNKINWNELYSKLNVDKNVKEVNWLLPGEDEAFNMLDLFIEEKLPYYAEKRNDPNEDVLSNLSPYLHFGQISAQRVALEILKRTQHSKSKESFLEELIVRRELADNFCYFNKKYDSFEGFPYWAKQTLNEHRKDKREYIYSLKELENAQTHDDLWNAAQMEILKKGKMHSYLRMYWAKKILQWTDSPETALKYAIYLNDKYELDGRDPNGYTGIAWSIGGVHDRAWDEKPIFGKIRYMNYNGCKKKFDILKYTNKIMKGEL
ncbi:deoxyribodipyrimidine photo-lyase [Rosettibacter firmus]|uniref:deoxyribodipyrimidine photo-lyase n=1 Tax=Rosettibacter firmus TaxID=3111522 RepID=UPI00336C044D